MSSSSTTNSNLNPTTSNSTISNLITHISTNVITWNEQEIEELINQRRYRNIEYHRIVGRSRSNFWSSVARRINRTCVSRSSGKQCRTKFQNLVSIYYVSKNNNIL